MFGTCEKCGLAVSQEGKNICFDTKREIKPEEMTMEKNCYFFIAQKYEDGELLTPEQHLALVQVEIAKKHMNSVI
ncbi:hypothetical protein RDV78_10290 [Bacillota bacterium LX-D]|nr:hypothetical protein [Bacillota bacterium LX-D]